MSRARSQLARILQRNEQGVPDSPRVSWPSLGPSSRDPEVVSICPKEGQEESTDLGLE